MSAPEVEAPVEVVRYRRVSTDEQAVSGLGLDAQLTMQARFLAQHPAWTVVAEYTDAGHSGSLPSYERPGLMDAVAALGPGRVLLASSRCRLARDRHVIAALEKEVEKARAKIVTTDGLGLVDDPASRLMIGIQDLFAEHERGVIRARVRRALAELKARGVQLGNPRWEESIEGARRARTTRAHTRALSVYPTICEIRTVGGVTSLAGIARALTARGVRTPRGGTTWTATAVKRALAKVEP